MKFVILFTVAAAMMLLSSCGIPAVEADRLRAENDSLRKVQAQAEDELNFYFRTMTEIAGNLEKIKAMDGMLATPHSDDGVNADVTRQVEENIRQVSVLMQANTEKIDLLNKRLAGSLLKSEELERVVGELTAENRRQSILIDGYIRRISDQDILIDSQRMALDASRDSNAVLTMQKRAADRKLAGATEQLYTAWYVFGTTKELRSQGIIAPNGTASKTLLKGNFNKDYFVRVDTREPLHIPLYSRRAKILTTHPDGSYVLQKQDGAYSLHISQPAEFWSVSNYLVISID